MLFRIMAAEVEQYRYEMKKSKNKNERKMVREFKFYKSKYSETLLLHYIV